MGRIRTIKPEFWTSPQVVECSPSARLLFVGMWNFCDDIGNHPAQPRRLKMEVFPGDDISTDSIGGLVAELLCAGLIFEYEVEDEQFWHVTGWKHQKVEKPTARYPRHDSASARRVLGDDSPSDRRRKGRDISSSDIPSSETEGKNKDTHTDSSERLSRQAASPSACVAATPRGKAAEDRKPPDDAPIYRPKNQDELDAIVEAWNAGTGQKLDPRRNTIHAEKIARFGPQQGEVERVARSYATALKDARPSLPAFARDYETRREQARSAGGKPPPAAWKPPPGRCPEHPGQTLPCGLCAELDALEVQHAAAGL